MKSFKNLKSLLIILGAYIDLFDGVFKKMIL